MIEPEGLIPEKDKRKDHEDQQGYNFLDNFQFHQAKRTTVFAEADAVSWNLEAVFKKCKAPAD